MKHPSDMEDNEKRCVECSWFYACDSYGTGCCALGFAELCHRDDACDKQQFVSRKEMRHYLAVLLQANLYRRDSHVPAFHKMPNPTELGKAIDFAYEFIKIYSNL